MHFSFPFTAGEYPEARYGHATCNYTLPGEDKENLMLLGGIDHGFCTMDIYTLVEIERTENIIWEKIINKDAYEEKANNAASKFVYQARKHCQDLYDIILVEKSDSIEVNNKHKKVKLEHEEVKRKCQETIDLKDQEIAAVDEENRLLEETMDNLMTMMQFEQYNCQVLEEKAECIEDYFKKMQDYMTTGDMIFNLIKKSKT